MNYNKKSILLGIILLTIIWIGNIVYYKMHVLREPIFIKHYYDIRTGMSDLRLFYIDDINSKNGVMSIVFPELDNENLYFMESDGNTDNRYYRLKVLNLTVYRGAPENMPLNFKNKVITKAVVTFLNGKTMEVDLGRIYLYNDTTNKPDLRTSNVSSTSDSNGSMSGLASFQLTKEDKITGLSCRFPELIDNPLKLSINNIDYKSIKLPLELKDSKAVDVMYTFNFEKQDIRKNYAYNFPIDIFAEDAKGNKTNGSFYLYKQMNSPSEYDIKQLLQAKKLSGN